MFHKLIEQYMPLAKSLAWCWIWRNPTFEDDLLSMAYLSLVRAIKNYVEAGKPVHDEKALKAYLRSYIRRKMHALVKYEDWGWNFNHIVMQDFSVSDEDRDLWIDVYNVVEGFTDNYKELFELVKQGYTYTEIGRMSDPPVSREAIRQRVQRMFKQIRKHCDG